MRAWILVLSLLGGGMTAHAADVAPAPPENMVNTAHLQVRGRVSVQLVEEAAALGEALYTHLQKHFGRAPDPKLLPLRLTIHPDMEAFRRELARRGTLTGLTEVGGYTWFGRGGSHVAKQRHAFDTRRLVIHELTHQFHFGCRPRWRRGRGPAWYREGLAEYFGWHRRTPTGVTFGVLDLVAPTRRAHDARRRVRSKSWHPRAFLDRQRTADYVDALALVGGLLSSPDEKVRATFRTWERAVLEAGGETRRIQEAFPDGAALKQALRDTWDQRGPLWGPAPSGWDEQADGWISGRGGRNRGLGRRFAQGSGGAVLRIRPGDKAWARVFVMGGRRFTFLEWRDGRFGLRGRDAQTWPAPAGARLEVMPDGALRLFAHPHEGTVPVLTIKDAAPGRWDLRLLVRSGEATFRLDPRPGPTDPK